AALFVPPSRSRMMMASALAWEKLGARCFPTFSGVLLVEAGKQIYAVPSETVPKRARRRYAELARGTKRMADAPRSVRPGEEETAPARRSDWPVSSRSE